jgi:hypothetical protein
MHTAIERFSLLASIATAAMLIATTGCLRFDSGRRSATHAQPPPSPKPTATIFVTNEVDVLLNQGEIVPFEVCGIVSGWKRPTDADQAIIWESPRYSGTLTSVLRYPWTHHFLISYGSASIDYDLINLSGLHNASNEPRLKCRQGNRLRELLSGNSAELWALGFRIRQIRRVSNTYAVTVVPDPTTVAFIHVSRPLPKQPLIFMFVTDSGVEVERLDESQYPYWPHR